jgi:hypothetical protein
MKRRSPWPLLLALCVTAAPAAQSQPLTIEDLGITLEALDGIVAVEHSVADAARVRSDGLRVFPGWRANLFSLPGASAEVRTFSFFAHPAASAELLGFTPRDGAGRPPPILESLSRALATLDGDVVISPYYSGDNCGLTGRVLGSTAWLRFDLDEPIEQVLSFLDEVGATIDVLYSSSPPEYRVRFPHVRSAFDLFALVAELDALPEVLAFPDLWYFGAFGCAGPSGAPSSGPSLPGGSEPPESIPMLGAGSLALLGGILLACALTLLRRRG